MINSKYPGIENKKLCGSSECEEMCDAFECKNIENKNLGMFMSKNLCDSSGCECTEICEEGKKNILKNSPEKLCDSFDCMCECKDKMIINGKIIFVEQNLD